MPSTPLLMRTAECSAWASLRRFAAEVLGHPYECNPDRGARRRLVRIELTVRADNSRAVAARAARGRAGQLASVNYGR
jgi:hypothetical protein